MTVIGGNDGWKTTSVVVYFVKEVNPSLGEPLFKLNGGITKYRLISTVKYDIRWVRHLQPYYQFIYDLRQADNKDDSRIQTLIHIL